jgi:hypothetical protein
MLIRGDDGVGGVIFIACTLKGQKVLRVRPLEEFWASYLDV